MDWGKYHSTSYINCFWIFPTTDFHHNEWTFLLHRSFLSSKFLHNCFHFPIDRFHSHLKCLHWCCLHNKIHPNRQSCLFLASYHSATPLHISPHIFHCLWITVFLFHVWWSECDLSVFLQSNPTALSYLSLWLLSCSCWHSTAAAIAIMLSIPPLSSLLPLVPPNTLCISPQWLFLCSSLQCIRLDRSRFRSRKQK